MSRSPDQDEYVESMSEAFDSALDERDQFLGRPRCVICGDIFPDYCYVINDGMTDWLDLKNRGWIPEDAEAEPCYEPRNALLMCPNHKARFNTYDFYIRAVPSIRKFIFVNFSGQPSFEQFHGKAIALDMNGNYTPLPSLFLLHELRVRGKYPFRPVISIIPDNVTWQDWILSEQVFDDASGTFKRDAPPSGQAQWPTNPATVPEPSGQRLVLNDDVAADILEASGVSPLKASKIDYTPWMGTFRKV